MLVEFRVSPGSDPYSVQVIGNSGFSTDSAKTRSFKISALVLALDASGVSYWSAGELVEAVTRAQTAGETVTRTLEMSDSEFEKFIDYRETLPAARRA
jgi:hypothetical protein